MRGPLAFRLAAHDQDVLGAAFALAATGWFAAGDRSTLVFDATGALQSHVLRENGASAAASAPAMEDALYEQVLRENRAR